MKRGPLRLVNGRRKRRSVGHGGEPEPAKPQEGRLPDPLDRWWSNRPSTVTSGRRGRELGPKRPHLEPACPTLEAHTSREGPTMTAHTIASPFGSTSVVEPETTDLAASTDAELLSRARHGDDSAF